MKILIISLIDSISNLCQSSRFCTFATLKFLKSINFLLGINSVQLENHSGIWFRTKQNVKIPIGPNLRIRRSEMRSWDSEKEDSFDMRKEWWLRSYSPKEGDFIIDVGAGMGEDSHVFSEVVGTTGSVLAIEAHPVTFKALSLFVDLNRITNVHAINMAASETPGSIWISTLPNESWQCNSITLQKKSKNDTEVTAIRLDDIPYLSNRDTIDFLKMNIEGAEVHALAGAKSTLSKTRNICVCCHDFLGPTTQTKSDVCDLLIKSGFTLSFTNPDSPPYERDFVYGKRNVE